MVEVACRRNQELNDRLGRSASPRGGACRWRSAYPATPASSLLARLAAGPSAAARGYERRS